MNHKVVEIRAQVRARHRTEGAEQGGGFSTPPPGLIGREKRREMIAAVEAEPSELTRRLQRVSGSITRCSRLTVEVWRCDGQ
jgi:hypothetical protein